MAYKATCTTLEKTKDDEPIFSLVGRDSSSPKTICFWIMENISHAPKDKLREALDCALEMRTYPSKAPD